MGKKDNFWDGIANSFHVTSSRSRAHRDKYFKIAHLILSKNPTNILDLGCGSGILEKELSEMGFIGDITAVDYSVSMLAIAQEFVKSDRIKFLRADIDSGLPVKGKFDVVVSINLFFFLENKQKFLEQVFERLKDKNSIFIMINPKPNDQTSNWEFLKEHFRDTNFREKIFLTFNELFNIPRYIKMTFEQSKITKMAKGGHIKFDLPEDIKNMAEKAKLNIISTEDIHAKQNWLFVMRRV